MPFILSLILLLSYSFIQAEHTIDFEEICGIPTEFGEAITETMSEIIERQNQIERSCCCSKPSKEEVPQTRRIFNRALNRRDLPCHPESPAIESFPDHRHELIEDELLESEFETDIMRAQTVSTPNFTAATLAETFSFPPDSMGVVGPQQFIIAVNGRIRSFNKSTGAADGVLNVNPDVFFQSVRNGVTTSDPRIRYDRLSKRWFITIITVNQPNRILIAVSSGPVISTATVWKFFFFVESLVQPQGDSNCLLDYPTLGIDANALYIGGNVFCGADETFKGTSAFVIRKSSVLGSGPIVVTAFRNLTGSPSGSGIYTPQGVDNFDANPTYGFFIGVDNATFGTLVMRRVSNPAGTPTMSSNIFMTVPTTAFPRLVPHKGNFNGAFGFLDSVDDRLMMAQIRKGTLWATHNIGVTNQGIGSGSASRNGSRWYQINLANPLAPTLIQAGTLFQPSASNTTDQRNYWMPSLMVSGQGHTLLGCSAAGSQEFINAALAFRVAGDAHGTLRTPKLYTATTTAYNPAGDPGSSRGRRWGDYSCTSLDPQDDMTMWTIQEFCNATNSYGVRVVKVLAPAPAKPISASPSSVPHGLSATNVTITGSSIDGSGFFDPGVGFDKRISALVSGGVKLNAVTYVNPTHVILNINTLTATVGTQTATIINPDKQQASGAILNIT